MDSLMKNNQTLKDMSPWMKAVWVGLIIFSAIVKILFVATLIKKIEAYVKQTNRSVLLNLNRIFVFMEA
jgi:hypothetical protein